MFFTEKTANFDGFLMVVDSELFVVNGELLVVNVELLVVDGGFFFDFSHIVFSWIVLLFKAFKRLRVFFSGVDEVASFTINLELVSLPLVIGMRVFQSHTGTIMHFGNPIQICCAFIAKTNWDLLRVHQELRYVTPGVISRKFNELYSSLKDRFFTRFLFLRNSRPKKHSLFKFPDTIKRRMVVVGTQPRGKGVLSHYPSRPPLTCLPARRI